MTLPPDIAAACPDLSGLTAVLLGQGSDCTAWAVGGRVVVKRPRHPAAALALAREAQGLAVARPRVSLPVPDLVWHPDPGFSRHVLLPGSQLLGEDYVRLPETAREALARFHADCHAIPPDLMRQAGAGPVQPWPVPETARPALDLLPAALRPLDRSILRDWAALPADPLGEVWGHFDAHGWNMAFDPETQRLNGIFDFGDSGIGPRHRDLTYSALISPDLTRRLGRAYAALTGFKVDLDRLRILSGAHRLWELAQAAPPDRAFQIDAFQRWTLGQT